MEGRESIPNSAELQEEPIVTRIVAKLNARTFTFRRSEHSNNIPKENSDISAEVPEFTVSRIVANFNAQTFISVRDQEIRPPENLEVESESEVIKSPSSASSRRDSDDADRVAVISDTPISTNGLDVTENIENLPSNIAHTLDSERLPNLVYSSKTSSVRQMNDSAPEREAALVSVRDSPVPHRRKSHESAVTLAASNSMNGLWRSADNLAPDSAFGSSLADIMESPGKPIFSLRERKGSLSESSAEGAGQRGCSRRGSAWRLVRNVAAAVDAMSPPLRRRRAGEPPGTPLPANDFDQYDRSNSGDGNDGPSPPVEKSPDPQNDFFQEGECDPEGLDPESLMFRDGRRKIDMVLVYEEEDLGVMTEAEAKRRDQRKIFQESLINEGLELELENKCLSFDEKTWFLKVHIPWKTEVRYAEVIGLKLPTKRFITISVRAWADETPGKEKPLWLRIFHRLRDLLEWNHTLVEPEPSFYASTYAKGAGGREEQFLVKDRYTQFSPAQRSLLVMQILLRARYDTTEKVGVRRLLNDGTYQACFPLHEGRYDKAASNGTIGDRRRLYLEWARPGKWYKKQPFWLIRRYFGDKIGLYFCWLGFYTKMLYAPAVVGTLCFLYGLASMDSRDNIPSKEICDLSGPGNRTLCPLCDKACQYQLLSDSCLFARLTYLFDNPSTVFFAIFMSFWATTFLELWKRKHSVIVWEWDLGKVDQDEEPRPEFETSVKTYRTNPVTREKEPYLPAWSRTLRFIATGSAVLFMIAVVLGAVLGTIIYRISLVSVIYGGGGFFLKRHAKIFTTMTAALINLTIIMILTKIYARLAIYLTNMENPRTQNEYEDSYTFKIFFFEFMNFYSSLIYIAFFKGRFFDYPGDDQARKSEFFKLKGDICDPAGCLSELCIQLAIIMIGKQCFNNFLEILYPKMWNWWRQRSHRANTRDLSKPHMAWEQDYHMQDPGRLALFDEYLEMILQYGFVTLFVAAFPLAPLFALLNNIGEIRLDAYKMVTQARRPLAERVEDIGAWYGILKGITYAAVVSNAFVIAYTSDYIPRMVYKFVYSPNNTLIGYIDHSLAVFNTSDYRDDWGADANEADPPTCSYRGYRNPPDHVEPYGLSPHYWHVFAARLAFVVVFEHVVFALTGLMQLAIPDVPSEVRTQMQREALLAKEAKYEHGLKKGREMEYQDILNHINSNSRQQQTQQAVISSWARRLSRVSDGLDAHVAVSQRPPAPGTRDSKA